LRTKLIPPRTVSQPRQRTGVQGAKQTLTVEAKARCAYTAGMSVAELERAAKISRKSAMKWRSPLRAEVKRRHKVKRQNGPSRLKENNMRMVRRIALYIGLVLLAALLSVGVAYGSSRMGVASTVAPWVGLVAFIVCAGVILYFMEFQRS